MSKPDPEYWWLHWSERGDGIPYTFWEWLQLIILLPMALVYVGCFVGLIVGTLLLIF